MILAIVGSRDLAGDERVPSLIDAILQRERPRVVVSGGAVGVDAMAAACAKRAGIPAVELRPELKQWDGRGAPAGMFVGVGYKQRNWLIAKTCDRLVRIAKSTTTSKGSFWTAQQAEILGRPVDWITL